MDPAIRGQTIADVLRRTAKRYPAKPGLICGDTRWTFAEFDAVGDGVAAGLSRLGVRFDDLAATQGAAPDTPQLASTDLAQIVYTSGTESSPKGAMLTHDA